jgi:hypothetical protein
MPPVEFRGRNAGNNRLATGFCPAAPFAPLPGSVRLSAKEADQNKRGTMRRFATCFIFGWLTIVLVPLAATAQGGGQSAEDLRRQLDELRGQMATQMRQVNALQARLDELERQKTAAVATPGAPAAVDQQATVPPAVTTQQVGPTTTTYQVFAEDPEAAPRIDNAPLDPKYPGFFRLPGTQTFLKIGG